MNNYNNYYSTIFAIDAVPFSLAFYGTGTGSIFLDDVGCVGTEQQLIHCPHASSVSCTQGHREDVGVRCQSKLGAQISL